MNAAEVDPRLLHQLATAGDAGLVDVVLVIHDGTVEVVVDRVIQRIGEQPAELLALSRLNAGLVRASARFIAALIQEPEVDIASASDIYFVFE